MDETPEFKSYEEEARYWRECAERLKRQRDEARDELNEFYTSSKELEMELETQLQQTEKKAAEYRSSCNRFKLELDAEREKNEKLVTDRDRDFENIHKELCQIKHMNSGLMRHVQDLEQKNDDLERAKRSLAVSLGDFEDKMNQEMERNAMLEVELGEKDRLSEMVQRLKDEVRDLRSELQVKATSDAPVPVRGGGGDVDGGGDGDHGGLLSPPLSPPTTTTVYILPPGTRCVCGAFQHATLTAAHANAASSPDGPTTLTPEKVKGKAPLSMPPSPSAATADILQHLNRKAELDGQRHASPLKGSSGGSVGINGSAPLTTNGLLTPSARISALNIVGDLLRKVGMSKCDECGKYRCGCLDDAPTVTASFSARTQPCRRSFFRR